MTQRTSRGHLTSMLRRLHRMRRWSELQTYVESQAFSAAFAAIDGPNRRIAAAALVKAWTRFDAEAPPPPYSMRVRWDQQRIAQLREVAKRCRDDQEIAREMAIPLRSAARARQAHVGPLRAQPGTSGKRAQI